MRRLPTMIGAGSIGNNLLVHVTALVTFGPDGTIKHQVFKYSFDCK